MITKFITEVHVRLDPFQKSGKICRLLLASLPSNARSIMRINTKVLSKGSAESSLLALKFSMLQSEFMDSRDHFSLALQRMERR